MVLIMYIHCLVGMFCGREFFVWNLIKSNLDLDIEKGHASICS